MYEDNMEPKIQSQTRRLTEEYRRLFGVELANDPNLSIINVILYDSSVFNFEKEDPGLEKQIARYSPLTNSFYTLKIPINSQAKSTPGETLIVRFNFRKQIYLKNSIQSYLINPFEKIGTNNIRDEQRGQFLNNSDLKQIRDNLEKIINDRMVPVFENFLFNNAERLTEIKKSKKKSLWSFFSPGSTPTPRGILKR